MQYRVFTTPILTTCFRLLSKLILRVIGWRVVGELPSHVKKCVVVAGPHTSNWDFPIFLMTAFVLKLDAHWLGKHTLFRRPFGGLMRWLGGIPVDRTAHNDVVAYVSELIRSADSFVLGVSPEGTRKATSRWHTGFWHIARAADVPVYVAFADFQAKRCGIYEQLPSIGDVEWDMMWIKHFYAGIHGRNEKNFSM